jgi:hypothetical protein
MSGGLQDMLTAAGTCLSATGALLPSGGLRRLYCRTDLQCTYSCSALQHRAGNASCTHQGLGAPRAPAAHQAGVVTAAKAAGA